MATHVYANDLEIASKSADGVATTAFPDPCWSPPSPSAGPILIPYGNVAFARDIANGTKTVFIRGQTVAIEDKAFFATSTGNEPATYAFQKGLRTGVIKGKAYFRSWSMDVMFEGLGVDRHTDLVSHNHGSMPSNTPLFPYVSRGFLDGHACKDEEKRIEKACGPDKDVSETRKKLRGNTRIGAALAKMKQKTRVGNRDKKNDWHWTDDHCAGLTVPLGSLDQAKEYLDKMSELGDALPEQLGILAALESELKDMVTNAAAKAAGKVAAKAAIKQGFGSAVPLLGNVAMGLWSAVDVALAVGDVNEIRKAAAEALEQVSVVREKAENLRDLSDKIKNLKDLPPDAKGESVLSVAADLQDALATLNACTRARKCNLAPYEKKGGPKNKNVEPATHGGCCPGQTGHHLIYGAMVKGACPGYDHGLAPTVCVEGVSQNHGSHERVHDAMDWQVRQLADAGGIQEGKIDMKTAIDMAATSHMAAFPLSKCSRACILAQLKAFYDDLTCKVNAVDKRGNPVKSSGGKTTAK